MMTSSLCFYEPVYKTCQRQPTELKLGKLIVQSKFHKICKFESHVTRNDVIMTSLPKTMENADLRETKQIIYHSKGIDESYPNMYFLLNLSHYVKVMFLCHLCQFLAFFYDARSPNMAMSCDPRSKFRKNLFFPNTAFNITKIYEISSRKALYFRSYQPKTSRGVENSPPPPPVLLGLTAKLEDLFAELALLSWLRHILYNGFDSSLPVIEA